MIGLELEELIGSLRIRFELLRCVACNPEQPEAELVDACRSGA